LDQNDFVEVRCGRGWGWLSGRLLLFIGAQQTYTHTHTQIHTPTYMDNKVQVPQESGLHMRCTRQKASQRNVRDGT